MDEMYSNTSHVKVYPIPELDESGNLVNSNTSHVKVYLQSFSIPAFFIIYSNTSHVKVYPWEACRKVDTLTHSNTSHVKVYLKDIQSSGGGVSFKYISC